MPATDTKKQQKELRTKHRPKVGYTADELARVDELRKQAGFKTRAAYIRARSLGYRAPNQALTNRYDKILLQLSGGFNNLNQLTKLAHTHNELPAAQEFFALKDLLIKAAQHIVDLSANDEDVGPDDT